jgi:flagellar assembly protein FliH
MIIKKRNELKIKEKVSAAEKPQDESVDLFDLDNIDFSQRQERRRGDRRRGYRRIDDRNLISRAQEEANTIKDSAAKEGYKLGLEQAKQDVEQVKTDLAGFLNAPKEVFEYLAPDILEISVDIARKIIKKEIDEHPEIILETIMGVLKGLSKNEPKIGIAVNPSQVAQVRENIAQMIYTVGMDSKINVYGDDTIEMGGCILKTNNGIIDATVNTQLEVIKEALREI